jgi:NAD(P)-dependent dehydrogenase (short-subunit alcohol dehydrogenase family)
MTLTAPESLGGVAPDVAELFSLRDKVAWITGAGRGMGRSIAVAFARSGCRLAVTGRTVESLTSLREELPDAEILVVEGNVADGAAMERTADRIVDSCGQLDVLVNMAGISPTVRRSEEIADREWRDVLDVNLGGTFYCCRAAARHMLVRESGSIVNVSSVHGSTGVANMAAYGASKGAVENLTRSLGVEWARRGVRVNCLAPGYIETDMTYAYLRSRYGDQVRDGIPMGHPGTASDIVGAALFLASAASRYVTGAIIPVDGGWTAR